MNKKEIVRTVALVVMAIVVAIIAREAAREEERDRAEAVINRHWRYARQTIAWAAAAL